MSERVNSNDRETPIPPGPPSQLPAFAVGDRVVVIRGRHRFKVGYVTVIENGKYAVRFFGDGDPHFTETFGRKSLANFPEEDGDDDRHSLNQ